MNKEIIQAVYASFYASLNSFMALDIASTYSRDNVIMRKGMPTTQKSISSLHENHNICLGKVSYQSIHIESRKTKSHSFHIVKFKNKMAILQLSMQKINYPTDEFLYVLFNYLLYSFIQSPVTQNFGVL